MSCRAEGMGAMAGPPSGARNWSGSLPRRSGRGRVDSCLATSMRVTLARVEKSQFLQFKRTKMDRAPCSAFLRCECLRVPDGLFPCALPYDELGSVPRSPRRRARWQKERCIMSWVNHLVAYLSWCSLGKPSGDWSGCVRCPLSSLQWAMVRRLREDVLSVCRLAPASVETSGGLRSVMQLLSELSSDTYAREDVVGPEGPKWLRSQSVSLPEKGAQIELRPPVVPAVVERVLRSPCAFDLSEDCVPAVAPGSCMRVVDWPALVVRLLGCGMACLAPTSARMPRYVGGLPARAGLFGVPKKDSQNLRMIVDRRRQNSLERRVRHVVRDALVAEGASVE